MAYTLQCMRCMYRAWYMGFPDELIKACVAGPGKEVYERVKCECKAPEQTLCHLKIRKRQKRHHTMPSDGNCTCSATHVSQAYARSTAQHEGLPHRRHNAVRAAVGAPPRSSQMVRASSLLFSVNGYLMGLSLAVHF